MDFDHAAAKLAACRPLATRLAHEGITAALSPAEIALLHDYEQVVMSVDTQFYTWLEDVRRAAGLLPSDMGLLRGALEHHYMSNPAIAARKLELLRRELCEH